MESPISGGGKSPALLAYEAQIESLAAEFRAIKKQIFADQQLFAQAEKTYGEARKLIIQYFKTLFKS